MHNLLGDPPNFSEKLEEFWNMFKTRILFHLWKERNVVFSGKLPFMDFLIADKLTIFHDIWFQITDQVNKVALEVKHLQ